MGLDLRLQHKMSQQLVMTPQLQQAIKLLQLSHLEMTQTLQQELIQNPVLEELDLDAHQGDQAEEAAEGSVVDVPPAPSAALPEQAGGAEDGAATADLDSYAPPTPSGEGHLQAPAWENLQARATSLHDHLRWQVAMASLAPDERAATAYLLEEVDEDGYLEAGATSACAQALEVGEAVCQRALATLQDCDPVGVGARDLRECLLLQARQQVGCNPLVLAILQDHLKAVEARNFAKVARALKVDVEQVNCAVRQIAQLEPRPGRSFAECAPHYIVPDLFVLPAPGRDGEFLVAVNEEGLPRLGISAHYSQGAHKFDGATREYVQEKLRAASWLLRSVHMRKRTMVRVMRSILTYQAEFFADGTGALRPMVLRDVAQDLGLHESTISRVTTNKYVHTPHGIYELKFFFNSTIRNNQGEGLASESVRQKIMRFIDRENKNEPLSDQKIVDLLRGHDISIARRTVAKYRKMLNKQPSSVRRRDF